MAKQKYNWQELKQEFITANLAPGAKGMELKELADKYSISPPVLWNRSCKEGWIKELGHTRKEKDVELSKQVQKAAVKIDKGKLLEEYEIRAENYEAATKLWEKLQKRWDGLSDEEIKKIPPLDLVKGILACSKAREQAAGLPAIFKLNGAMDIDIRPGELSVEQCALWQARNAEMAKMLSDYLKMKKDEGTIDV